MQSVNLEIKEVKTPKCGRQKHGKVRMGDMMMAMNVTTLTARPYTKSSF